MGCAVVVATLIGVALGFRSAWRRGTAGDAGVLATAMFVDSMPPFLLQEDYVLMAEAKGLDARGVRRHAQRNALLPVSTITLLGLGTLVGGAAVVETVFSYPGLGRLIYESVLARDYPVLQGALLLLATGVLLANLAGDLLYPLLDPRVRRARRPA